jgi:hypothetical protein
MKTFLDLVKYLKEDLTIEYQEEWKAKNREDKRFFRRELRKLF